jgi:dTDP-4-dehydrorhamnose reductase
VNRSQISILVTGASGMFGANFMLEAQDAGASVTALYGHHPVKVAGVRSAGANLESPESVETLLREVRPDWIIHAAAMTDVDQCETDARAAYAVNARAAGVLARMAADIGAGFLYVSTDSVFDGVRGGYRESDNTGPVNAYAVSKLEGERLVQTALTRHLVLRTNIYGWNAQPKRSLAEWVLWRLESGQAVPGFCDVVFTPILVNDLSQIMLRMIRENLTGLYHIGSADVCSKYEFACRVASSFDFGVDRVEKSLLESAGLKARRPRNTSLNSTKIQNAVGTPMPTVAAGVERFRQLQANGFVKRLRAVCQE